MADTEAKQAVWAATNGRRVIIVTGIIALISGLADASGQVAAASAQAAAVSQLLADGTAAQAAALEESSTALEEISSMTKQNVDNAVRAKFLMAEAKNIVDKVDRHMNSMSLAIADEVRRLALRVAQAAQHTNDLIENTISSVHNGHDLAQIAQQAFNENVVIYGNIGSLVSEIEAASGEQAKGVSQVSMAVNDMDSVVQSTAVTADKAAGVAENMNIQADSLKSYGEELVVVIGGMDGLRTFCPSDQEIDKNILFASYRTYVNQAAQPGHVIPMRKEGLRNFSAPKENGSLDVSTVVNE